MDTEVMRFVEPTVVTPHFHLRPGDSVADFGAGRGFFIEPLAAAVESSGPVHAIEIQKNLVEAIGDLIQTKHLEQVRVQWADLEEANGIKLPDGSLDCGVIVNTLFQLEDKATAVAEMVRTIRSGGKFFVIDWSESFNNLGPEPNAVITEADARAVCETAGLVYERSFPAGDHHYGLAFRKP